MLEFSLGYREVVPDQTLPEKWKEITLNTGGSQSTLQDIKVPERAGGYSYKDNSKHFTRNRFIYWRICHDVLELVEHSLDINLANCKVRYKFTDTPILDGISIHETVNSVVILVVTVSSVHKLTFPHPDKVHKSEHLLGSHPELSVQSILGEASVHTARDPHTFHVIASAGTTNSPVPHVAASWLTLPHEEALFALAYNSGTILVLRLDTVTGLVHTSELKQDSIMPRFLSGIATAFRGRSSEGQVAMSLVIHTCGNDTYLFALCREGNVRMWSCNKSQCVAVADVAIDNRVASQGAHGHILRKVLGSDNELYLGAYLKFGTGCEFSILKPVQDAGLFKFVRTCTLFAPDQHLVDFAFTPTRLWAVWRTTDMDTVAVTHAQLPLSGAQVNSEWETAILEQPPDRDYIVSDPGTDPRQAYINYIFHPGQFSLADITRALSIYRRSNLIADMTLSPAILKERVCMAVEAEIQAEVMDYELMDEDYLEIANRCWSKFYSCVIQYHVNGTRPVGLLLLPSVYGIALLKKSSFSLLRPMEALEHLMLSNEKSYASRFKSTPVLSQDEDTCQDLITLMSALVMLEEQLSEEVKTGMERELYHLQSPDIVVEDLFSRLAIEPDDPLSDFDFQMDLHHKLENVKDPSSAMGMLLEALTYDLGQPNKMKLDMEQEVPSRMLLSVSHLFSSQLGISTVAESVAQITLLRFSICRDLLILQQIVLSRPEVFDSQVLHAIKSFLAPRTVVLTQAYYVVMWICESTATCTPPQALLETSVQRLSSLKLTDSRATLGNRQQRSLSLLELFVQSGGAKHAHTLMAHATDVDPSALTPWHYGMLTHVTLIAQLVWPISGNFIFPEWLLSSCQFLLVQEYVRLLRTWCEWNSASRKFILAVALLEMGETRKACDHFLRASNGVLTDSFLADVLLESNVTSDSNALVQYYLKVIELFEQHNASDCIIELAETAITIASKDDPNLPTLHSIVFTQHLTLGHHTEAYHCLNANPDAARRADCLRQLVVTLFERKKLMDLVSFPYVDMYEDLERIVEGRARSVDLMENNYYNFLYSFHINKGNMRKAASVMYEQAMRLSQESHSASIIARQSQCLLACINSLNLVNEKYKWIVRPVVDSNYPDESNPKKKRSIDGREVLHYKVRKQVEVLELADIRKEYYLVDARLKLSKLNSEMHTVAQACPSELIAILSSVGLYTTALHLCDQFNVPKSSVLENLASHCLRLSEQEDPNAWDWLIQNDVFDISGCSSNVANISWRLLERLTLLHEKKDSSELHKGVARKLLHRGAFLPQWLMSSYKKRNPAELLRLLLNTGRLLEATDLALDYVNAVLGEGKEHFGLETPLVSTAPAVWLPYNTLELLLLELEHASKEDPVYIESHDRLKKTLDHYIDTVVRVSTDMIRYKVQNAYTIEKDRDV
ncbi:nuclear pore complex protein Nup160 homolog isoform X2 [Venturia canescens]|uniref:nuclear pore complex protein Nup160 homolog isoform X2 n=1 Tax=Venturia canescens TaxID=32260 RepID=UPI001C9C9550|nr:nuclear pore complex protein Nup160 homolog isoform X2 [Venturia canescens]